jgi:hypothetical protein
MEGINFKGEYLTTYYKEYLSDYLKDQIITPFGPEYLCSLREQGSAIKLPK